MRTDGPVLAVSRSGNSRLREVELLAKDLDDPDNGGDHPWTIADGVTSTLLLFNQSSKPQWFNVRVAAGATVWTKGYQLQPNQILAISINDLRRTGAKDDKGHAFPKDIWSGQVGWSVPQKNAGRGRLLQSNPETAMARNFSCGEVMELCGADIAYLYNYILDGQTVDFGTIEIQTCLNTCNGTPGGEGGFGYSYQWNSENSGIASVSGSSYNQSANVFGASPGGTDIEANVWDAWCQIDINPPPPAYVAPKIISISPSTIPIGGGGVQVTILGGGFGTSPSLNLPSGVSPSNQQSSDARIVVTLMADYSATIGNANLSVTANAQTSNGASILLNGPAYAVVQNDIQGNYPDGTPVREVTYIVYNKDDTTSAGISIAENYTVSGWSCTSGPNGGAQPNPPLKTTACDGSFQTGSDGSFPDLWGWYSAYGPTGCGLSIVDHWQWCSPSGPNPGKTFMTLSGYIHTNGTEINGYDVPPAAEFPKVQPLSRE